MFNFQELEGKAPRGSRGAGKLTTRQGHLCVIEQRSHLQRPEVFYQRSNKES